MAQYLQWSANFVQLCRLGYKLTVVSCDCQICLINIKTGLYSLHYRR